MASKWYGWNVRSIAKTNPKPFFDFFRFSQKLSIRFEQNFVVILHPKGPLRVQRHQNRMTGWDVRNIAIISPKMAKKQPFFDFFRFSQQLSIRFERNFLTVILHHIRVLYVQWHQNRMAGM